MAEAGAQLDIERLSLSFGGLRVLDNVSFAVEGGELLALIGPNGAGKTSVLNCVSGLYRASEGRILFEGRDLRGLQPHRVAQVGVARTFQHGELFPHMTVLENLLVGRHCKLSGNVLRHGIFWGRVKREEVDHRRAVEEILDFVELERYRKTLVANLPFGIQKVVGFARALAMEPKLLLLDEPSAGLNREEKEDLARFILRIKYELGVTMIWVEHDMQMVADMADRIFVLNYGEPVMMGTPDEVLSDSRVVEAYLGSGHV